MTQRFTLLMAVYGSDDPRFFARAFTSSTVDQRLRPDEIVLIKDGPVPPELDRVIRSLIDDSPIPVQLVEFTENRGLAAGLTAGLELASHEIIARMDADDIARPERFESQLPLFDEGYDIVGAGMFEFEAPGEEPEHIVARRTPPCSDADIRAYLPFHDPFNHPTVVYRRSAVQAAGGYEPLGLMEDYWLWARMLANGARAINLPDPLVLYRVDSGAFARRGGLDQLRTELQLQRRLRSIRAISRAQYLRNIVIRGGYRLVPEGIRRRIYRSLIGRSWREVG